jgi:hypothetical protein
MKHNKHHEAIIAFVRKNPNSTMSTIVEGLPKLSTQIINLSMKQLMEESSIAHNQDTGTYSMAAKNAVIQSKDAKTDKKEATKAEVKVAPKTEKKADEAGLGDKLAPGQKGRDNTRYSFNGKHNLSKGRLILELVRQYVKDHKTATVKQINEAFLADKVNKRYLVIRTKADASKFTVNKKTRFLLRDDELVSVANAGKCAVCSQWDINNVTQVLNAFKGKYKVTVSK